MISHARRFAASAFVLATALASLAPSRCEAGLLVKVQDAVADAGSGGAFDVYLVVSGGMYDVTAFSFGLAVDPASPVRFTSVTPTGTTDPYIFGTQQDAPFSSTTFPAWSLTASDAYVDFPWIVTLNDGDVVGLGRVTFTVDAGAAGGGVLVSVLGGGATGFVDLFGDPIGFETSPGAITVIPSNVIPEPASLALLALASAPLAFAASRGRPA